MTYHPQKKYLSWLWSRDRFLILPFAAMQRVARVCQRQLILVLECWLLANVNSLVAVARPSVYRLSVCLHVCRLSVTFVRPTQAVQIFGIFLWHWVPWPSADIHEKFYEDRPRRTPPLGELKNWTMLVLYWASDTDTILAHKKYQMVDGVKGWWKPLTSSTNSIHITSVNSTNKAIMYLDYRAVSVEWYIL